MDQLGTETPEPATTVRRYFNVHFRGLTTKDYVALSFTNYPSVAALKVVRYERKRGHDGNRRAIPSGVRWVDYYISSGDKQFTHDFA
jgi:hypothetical protein